MMHELIFVLMIAAATNLRYPTGTAPGSVEIANFNGDGKYDIVVANEQSDDVSILLGDGKGGFMQAKGSPFPAGHLPNDIAIGDFNRDAKLDLAVANHEEKHLSVLLGDGNGGFTSAPHSPVAVEARPHVHGVATGDLNGDGKDDLAIVDSPTSMAEGRGKDGLTVLLGNGNGEFTKLSGSPFATGKSPNRVAIGDVNGDGVAEIAVSSPDDNDITLFLMSNRGTMASSSTIAVGGKPKGLAIHDLNGDGNADIVTTNNGDNAVTVILSK